MSRSFPTSQLATVIRQLSKRRRVKTMGGASSEPGLFHRLHLGATTVFKRALPSLQEHALAPHLRLRLHPRTRKRTCTRDLDEKARATTLPEGRRQGFQGAIATTSSSHTSRIIDVCMESLAEACKLFAPSTVPSTGPDMGPCTTVRKK